MSIKLKESHHGKFNEPELFNQVAQFIAQGCGFTLESLSTLGGGANNLVLLARCQQTEFVVKAFWQIAGYGKAKFDAEVAFYLLNQKLENKHGNKHRNNSNCPNLLVHDESKGLLLLSFVSGDKCQPEEVTYTEQQPIEAKTELEENVISQRYFVEQSLRFIHWLNQDTELVNELPLASDATDSFEELLKQLQQRQQRLVQGLIEQQDQLSRDCLAFVEQELSPWLAALSAKMTVYQEISFPLNIASPSDFGMHNALVEGSSENVVFFDFEYAGKDSAIKLVCDYFCQPRYPIDTLHIKAFINEPLLNAAFIDKEAFSLFLQGTQLKWCFIILNEFVPKVAQRRAFSAAKVEDLTHKKQHQLHKCQGYLSNARLRLKELNALLTESVGKVS